MYRGQQYMQLGIGRGNTPTWNDGVISDKYVGYYIGSSHGKKGDSGSGVFSMSGFFLGTSVGEKDFCFNDYANLSLSEVADHHPDTKIIRADLILGISKIIPGVSGPGPLSDPHPVSSCRFLSSVILELLSFLDMLILIALFVFPTIFCMPPPNGLNLKPAKQISTDQVEPTEKIEPPPNLQLRSRMMAAMNSNNASNSKAFSFAQPLILKKSNKKAFKTAKPVEASSSPSPASESEPIENIRNQPSKLSPEEVRQKFTSASNERVNLKVRPVLTTNFIDANGKVVRDVVSVPIRVSDGHIHSIPKNSKNVQSSASVVETGEKNVNVSFRSSLPLWLV
ncbi:unnamed protein product [Caenorhabditis bovis]|uniref:Uncharacterized protein n=1 Tax=Caenorhabditis bovis TaxID=2654633 RepID=A0A8S1FCD3_9PELO|nr:unnamed protein product [Caenorhabditis bovis]